MPRRLAVVLLMLLSTACSTAGTAVSDAELPKPEPTPDRVMLPQEHQYQRRLRAYMATLVEKDFDHGVTALFTVTPPSGDIDDDYRNFMLPAIGPPLVGSKRGVPMVNNPPRLYLLSSIEGPKAIIKPLGYPEVMMMFTLWKYPGNPYYNNRALKLRAFVNASINLMMTDDAIEKNPKLGRADWRAYQMMCIASAYPGFKDEISPEARRAFQAGVKKLATRMMEWGPRGEESNFDAMIPMGLWYAARVCEDREFSARVEVFSKMMFTDPRYFHPAGYWVDRGGIDTGFGGQANVFGVWVALASDWPFAKDAMDRAYRLRAHLILPEPDGTYTGPAAFNTRLSSPANVDQWEMGWRNRATTILTNEAAPHIKLPTKEEIAKAPGARSSEFARQIHENPIKSGNGSAETPYVYFPNDEIPGQPWAMVIFDNWQFPLSMNFGYEFYRKGSYERFAKLEKENSPYLKYPFERDGTFVRAFDKAFIVAKQPTYGVVLHTGPVGRQSPDNGIVQATGPLGFGGGQLSAFWTAQTGSVILGRRGGMIHERNYDKLEEWRSWPIHAVTGVTTTGKILTSARIATPDTNLATSSSGTSATVRGEPMGLRQEPDPNATPEKPKVNLYDAKLEGKFEYTRKFEVASDALRVETTITSTGEEKIAELYETIPVYLRDTAAQKDAAPTKIEFQINGTWTPATDAFQEKVTAIKLTRFNGAVHLTFNQPCRVKLAPAEWKDSVAFAWGAARNVLIDLLPAGGQPGEFRAAKIGYSVSATKP